MSLFDNIILRTFVSTFHISLRPRGIPIRYTAFVITLSFALCTLFYNHRHIGLVVGFRPGEDTAFRPPEPSAVWTERAARVKEAFLHAYHGYERYAFSHDELRPISNTSSDSFNAWGVTAVDSLDTMLLMGLMDEYERALPSIMSNNFSLPTNTRVPFFETVIRYLGGLLSAYALTNDSRLLTKADELGTKLSPAFNTKSGFPMFAVNTYKGVETGPLNGLLAEIASFQLEYTYLGKITGKKEYVDRATTVTKLLHSANLTTSGGMYPTRWDLPSGTPFDLRLSVGGMADSAHEYTLKQYLLTSLTDKATLEMYIKMTTYVINNLLFISPQRHLVYVTDMVTYKFDDTRVSHKFEHLSCFFPGLLALGAKRLPLDKLESLGINMAELAKDLLPKDRQGYEALAEFNLADLHIWVAKAIAQTCYITYADQPTGLGPDTISILSGKNGVTRWMDALQEWNRLGRPGSPPGVGDIPSWSGTTDATTANDENLAVIQRDYGIDSAVHYLRPEAVESFYILWRVTGDERWRQWGWHVFQALEEVARTQSGYACVDRVHTRRPIQLDSMPSYFLAETLKYLYLLFTDKDTIPLDRWVFNTEGHPLPVFEWTEEENAIYGLE
ncbi:glycoside hydrolase family 47 protein [Scleroderma yunnanense]